MSYTDARGALPWRPGDHPPEKVIGRIRGDHSECEATIAQLRRQVAVMASALDKGHRLFTLLPRACRSVDEQLAAKDWALAEEWRDEIWAALQSAPDESEQQPIIVTMAQLSELIGEYFEDINDVEAWVEALRRDWGER